jgi:secreted trypsin-like serine protease
MNTPVRGSLAIRLAVLLAAFFMLTTVALAQTPEPRIIGGQEAEPGEWPWQVALVQRGGSLYFGQFCGGSLIARDWALTAASCVTNLTAADLDVVAGIHNLADPDPNYRRVGVVAIVVAPGYAIFDPGNDVALLQLSEPIDERPADGATLPISFIDLAGEEVGSLAGEPATVTGWGNTLGLSAIGEGEFPETLQEAQIPITSAKPCENLYGSPLEDNVICAGVLRGGIDVCTGDEGGPLVIFNESEGRWQLVGITADTAFDYTCGLPDRPRRFARVASHLEWLDEVTHPFVATDQAFAPAIMSELPLRNLLNGDFEQGQDVGWQESSSNGWAIVVNDFAFTGVTAHGGEWAAWLGGDYNETSVISQPVTLAAEAPFLNFYHLIGSEDACGYDFASVNVNGAVVQSYDLCFATATGGWLPQSVDLTAYAGQLVVLDFVVVTDSSGNSNWFLDDVTFSSSPAAAASEATGQPANAAALRSE